MGDGQPALEVGVGCRAVRRSERLSRRRDRSSQRGRGGLGGSPDRRCALPVAMPFSASCVDQAPAVGAAGARAAGRAAGRRCARSCRARPARRRSATSVVHRRPVTSASPARIDRLCRRQPQRLLAHAAHRLILRRPRPCRSPRPISASATFTALTPSRSWASASSGRTRHHRLPDRFRLAIAGERAGAVAEIRAGRAALDVAHLVVGGRQLLLQPRIVGALGGEAVEIFERRADDQLARGRRARQRRDGVVELEQERVGELPHVLEAALGARSRCASARRRSARAIRACHDRDAEAGHQRQRRRAPPRRRRRDAGA